MLDIGLAGWLVWTQIVADKPRLTAVGSGEAAPAAQEDRFDHIFSLRRPGGGRERGPASRRQWGQCLPEQLSAWFGHRQLNSGAFRNKVAAAKLYGVLEGSRN